MLPVTEAFMNAFKESEFECELYESEIRGPGTHSGQRRGVRPRYLVARFPGRAVMSL